MENVTIKYDEWKNSLEYAKEIEQSMKTAYEYCSTLKATIYGSSWKGKSRDAFLTYVEIIAQYHKELNEILSKQTKALKNIEKYRDNFSNDSMVTEVKQL